MVNKVLVTGGAGYIGSALVAALLRRGAHVTVLDDLWFSGDSLLPFLGFDTFQLLKRNLCDEQSLRGLMDGIDAVVHLAAIVGFPACDKAGRSLVWQLNVEGTQRVYQAATAASVGCMIFASSYSNYGESSHGELVTEESPLTPKSTYAESKIEAEQFLLAQRDSNQTAPICLRLATVFGVSPRTRFDLMANQFVLEAFTRNKLVLYQEDFKRSFVHVRDVVRAIMLVLDAPLEKTRNQVFNVGSESLNTSKLDLARLIQTRLPRLAVEYLNTSFSGDMRSVHVSFEKIRRMLGYDVSIDLEQGIDELLWALHNGVISDPLSPKYRNHPPLLL